jgi:radical SAM-linked protein
LLKFRLAYSKLGKVRFLGHRDVARLWERTLRKAEIPVAMSTGFTPRARISFGLALPTGAESLIELLDVTVDSSTGAEESVAPQLREWRERIDAALPEGFAVTHVGEIARGDVSLQESVTASSWILLIDHPDVTTAVESLRASESVLLTRERKGEMNLDDIRPGILEIEVANPDRLDSIVDVWPGDPLRSGSGTAISAMLTTSGRGIRPTELVQALIPGDEPWDHLTRVLRTQQWIDEGGQRIDVLSASVAHPQVCA